MVDWKEIQRDYETSDISMKELAAKYDVKVSTLRSRKNRNNWKRSDEQQENEILKHATHATKNDATQNATQRKNVATDNYYKELNNSDLNDKQKAFCEEYLACFNATRAYKKVYQVDYETARVAGSRLLTNVNIQKVIEQLKKEHSTNLFINNNDVLQKLVQMFFVDLNDYIGHGSKKAIDEESGEEYQRSYAYFKEDKEVDDSLIAQITLGRNGAEVKPYDKIKIAKLLMERLPDAPGEEKENVIVQAINQSIKDNKPVTKDDVEE